MCFVFLVHVGSVRQTATIISMTQDHLRTGDKAIVRFRFIKNPEYLRTDMRMVFREGRTKAIGNITKLYPHVSAVAQNTRVQRAQKKAQEANHQAHPANEPQKPSKKNRRVRGGSAGKMLLVPQDLGAGVSVSDISVNKTSPPSSAVTVTS